MEQAKEQHQSGPQGQSVIDDLLKKVKAVAQGPHGDLFIRIVDDFYDQVTEEYFSSADLAEIEKGFEQIRRGEYVALEELEKDLDI